MDEARLGWMRQLERDYLASCTGSGGAAQRGAEAIGAAQALAAPGGRERRRRVVEPAPAKSGSVGRCESSAAVGRRPVGSGGLVRNVRLI